MDRAVYVTSPEEQAPKPDERDANVDIAKIICVKCGNEGFRLHRGCRLCEECCDCRPLGT